MKAKKAAPAIDDRDREVFLQGRVLQAVIHHDDGGAGRLRECRAGRPVARNDGRPLAREQELSALAARNPGSTVADALLDQLRAARVPPRTSAP